MAKNKKKIICKVGNFTSRIWTNPLLTANSTTLEENFVLRTLPPITWTPAIVAAKYRKFVKFLDIYHGR